MIDIGANLAHESFGPDRAQVLERAAAAGVEAIVVTGSDVASSEAALALARAHPGHVFATAGLHPHLAAQWSAEVRARVSELAQEKECVALGECGLDFHRDLSPRADQRRAFSAQLALAADARKPVFLHQRDAHGEFLPILKEYRPQLAGAVTHCFTDSEAALEDYLALDCHVGITGWICDERRGTGLRSAVARIPDGRLLAETDAPYLLPRNVQPRPRTRRNEPMYLPWVIRALAEARGQDAAHVARVTAANARRFFRLGG